jgi:uncharacterized membrane protein YgaE (UPF0421/DUF939 family)
MAAKRDKRPKLHIDGVTIDADAERIGEALEQLRRRAKPTIRERWHRVRFSFIVILQAGIAAGLAWWITADLIGARQPVFAPIAAVGTLASAVGQRFRRTVELIVGVALGIGVGDTLILLIGSGPWQLGLVVTLAIVATIFLGGSPAVVTQAAATAVLLTALTPMQGGGLAYTRVLEALVGGATALIVSTLLLPFNPLRVVDRAARPALDTLAEELTRTADALEKRDAECAQRALDRLHEVEQYMQGLEEALEGGRETATLAPVRWRRRGALTQYVESSEYIEHAVHNSGTLIRRAVTLIEDEEPVPAALPSAVRHLADAVRQLLHELGRGAEPEGARERSLRAVSEAGRAYAEGVGFSGSVVVAQLRTTASDLLRATGIERAEANRQVRKAVSSQLPAGRSGPPQPSPETH